MSPSLPLGQRLLLILFCGCCQIECRAERQAVELAPDPNPALTGKATAKTGGGRGAKDKTGGVLATATCNETIVVQKLDQMRICPKACPYMADLVTPCHFICTTSDRCGLEGTDPKARIADLRVASGGICRRCAMAGCRSCMANATKDRCEPEECMSGYTYNKASGECSMLAGPIFRGLKVLVGLVVLFFVFWYFDLVALRPSTNAEGVEQGLRFREATKLKFRGGGSESGEPYPLSTNLQRVSSAGVAGPGTVLHFNFQLVIILWALVLGSVWCFLCRYFEPDLLLVGLRSANSPAWLCAVTHWGHALEKKGLWLKVVFLAFAYVFSVVGTVIYAATQLRQYSRMDDTATMKDFMAIVRGLPRESGSDPTVEARTKAFLEEKTQQKLVGVSMAWDIYRQEAPLYQALEADLVELEEAWQDRSSGEGDSGGTSSSGPTPKPKPGPLRRALMRVDNLFFCLQGVQPAARWAEPPDQGQLLQLLKSLRTLDFAFAVFCTEAARDAAVEASQAAGGFEVPGWPGSRVRLLFKEAEPSTLEFPNMGITTFKFALNLAWGWMVVLAAQVLWIVCAYFPYAYYVSSFSYAMGDEPDWKDRFVLGLLVTGGNQVMYQVCSLAARSAGFVYNDRVEAYYTALYCFTCFLNILVDLGITAVTAYKVVIGSGAHTMDGAEITQVQSLHDVFETIQMQRSLGLQTWIYNFPGTFVIPFIVEPIAAIFLVRHLMIFLVQSHKELTADQSERMLSIFVPMDMSRYADIILNVLLSTVSLYFAPGFFLKTFWALAVAHLWILVLDHVRVLRCVPAFWYSSDLVERFSQALLGVPCGLILGALVVKSNCMSGTEEVGRFCVRNGQLLLRVLAAFSLHMVLYLFVHRCCLRRDVHDYVHMRAQEDYATVATQSPPSWFNVNPVHCLRSKLMHHHQPPCHFYRLGKEHLLRPNPSIACHFGSAAASGDAEAMAKPSK